MKRHEFVARNILSEMVRRGITAPEMANQMNLSLATFYRRMRHPEELTIGELILAAAFLKLPMEALIKKGA